ncbi:helix-turn-helix domain-containing protein [Pedobacter sp. BMA]|uniref:helix-turn-helix domain-containing protein n=1 Tax=Pedobacter sp. BMA TaxID=1663685 RepID=UPI000649617D|nr:helix-turn-helix domain-containing protein [Pedobacter sp. BMA]KLT64725.1 hypothetical protein AB669_13320 [Pedobacter sp. BMA]
MKGSELIAEEISQLKNSLNKLTGIANSLLELFTNVELMDKPQVMDMLKVSDSTYKRLVKDEVLKPMKLLGGDRFYKKDVLDALELSRKKGKL